MKTLRELYRNRDPQVAAVGRDDSVLDAARLMNERRIGSVVVLDGDKVVGILTERDVLTGVVAAQRHPAATKVEKVMSAPCIVASPDDSIERARNIMAEKRIRHLPVVEDGRLVAIVSSRDVLTSAHRDQEEKIQYLNEYLYGMSAGDGSIV
jgi:CBS domain-containing protein